MALEIPTLGRPFTLGMLYDCCEEKLIPGVTLWNNEDLEGNSTTAPQNNTDFEVLTADSVSDKSSALNVSGTLMLSLLGGMIDVGGSGKYLTDTKKSKKQARVTLKYRRTSEFEQLSMNQLSHNKITHPEVFEKGIATHVVTGILYGTQAFFIFDQKLTNSETSKDIQGQIEGMITKIGELTGQVRMNDAEREVVRQLTCKFHGDFALEKNPVTYEEAMQVYASLPQLFGENGEGAVPIKVWLYPLKLLDSRATRHVVRDPLLFRAEKIMEKMREDIMECNDMMRHPATITFPALGNKIIQFKKLYEHFRIMYQKRISQVLSSVRGGNMEESSLEETLTRKEESPFSDQKIRKFLDRRWREMDLVHSVLQQLTGFKIVSEQREIDRAILDLQFTRTNCFNFSLAYKDSYLIHLERWLYNEPWKFPDDFSDDKTDQWFEPSGLSEYARRHVKLFREYAAIFDDHQYLVTSVECTSGPGIGLHHFRNGDLAVKNCMCGM